MTQRALLFFVFALLTGSHVVAEPFVLNRGVARQAPPPFKIPLPALTPKINACPDIRVAAGQSQRPGGHVRVTFKVLNSSGTDFVSRPGQQALIVTTPKGRISVPFSNLPRGAEIAWSDTLSPDQLPARYKAAVSFRADVFVDDNPLNDDCKKSNNQLSLTAAR